MKSKYVCLIKIVTINFIFILEKNSLKNNIQVYNKRLCLQQKWLKTSLHRKIDKNKRRAWSVFVNKRR